MHHVSNSHFRNGKIAEDFANLSWDGGKFPSKLGHYCTNSISCLDERYHLGHPSITQSWGGADQRKNTAKEVGMNFRNIGQI